MKIKKYSIIELLMSNILYDLRNKSCKKGNKKCKNIILNQPIKKIESDWIGVSTYVDKLDGAVNSGAKMIAITSDFGSGKSSIISLFREKYKWFKRKIGRIHIHTINMWSDIERYDKKCISERNEIKSIDIHKSFLYNLISQINSSKGSYISKRLSKNYGLVKMQSDSLAKTFIASISILLLILGELFRRFASQIINFISVTKLFDISLEMVGICTFIFYTSGILGLFMIIINSDFIFSTTKSEGKRELDENILIDYYNHSVIYNGFGRKYIFIVEDIDRIDNPEAVINFLKEMRKYYLTVNNTRSWLHHNTVSFIIPIKSEVAIKNRKEDDPKGSNGDEEKVFPKIFDYIIELKKINIDNYDSLLEGLLKEFKEELINLELINKNDKITISSIKGMEWMIRGKVLDIRKVKERLNNTLTLYESLKTKFPHHNIQFEKCAVATYVTSEYANDYYYIKDRDFEKIIELYIADKLDEEDLFPEKWTEKSEDFRNEIIKLIKRKLIDTSYRIYFYNYPKESNLYNVSESMIYNAIIYDERPKDENEFRRNLKNISDELIMNALKRVDRLNLYFPTFCLEWERIFKVSAKYYPEKTIENIEMLDYSPDGMNTTLNIISKFLDFDKDRMILNEKVISGMASMWNKNSSKSNLIKIRSVLAEKLSDKTEWYTDMYMGTNPFISTNEIEQINNIVDVLALLNYETLSDESIDTCKIIHEEIIQNKIHADKFYIEVCRFFGTNMWIEEMQEYCHKVYISKEINEILREALVNEEISTDEYLAVVNGVNNVEEYIVDTIEEYNVFEGASKQICNKLYESKKYLEYVTNMLALYSEQIDLTNEEVKYIIENNPDIIFEESKRAWDNLRKKVLSNEDLIKQYIFIFADNFPIVSEQELEMIGNIKIALLLLEKNVVDENCMEYITEYFNCKYRNGTETYLILKYIAGLKNVNIANKIFYSLNMDNVRYRQMSAKHKKEILDKMTVIAKLNKAASDKIKYMEHVKEAVEVLEENLYVVLNGDEKLRVRYVNFIKTLKNVNGQTLKNIVNMNVLYQYNSLIINKLYEYKYYYTYVKVRTFTKEEFEIEEDKVNILWDSYVRCFLSEGIEITRGYMYNNKIFMEMLVTKKVYEDIDDKKINRFANAPQSKLLLIYVFEVLSFNMLISYLSQIKEFKNAEAEEFVINKIIKMPKVLLDDKIYDNIYTKLTKPYLKRKYTSARKIFDKK